MNEYIKVAVDAMGGDNAPQEIVKGAVEAVNESSKVKVYLVGMKEAVERELEQAVPNLTMKYEEGVTPDDFALLAVDTALHSAKPSFANHKMFRGELGENYVIASCYNGLLLGGGFYTLCSLILGNIAKRAQDIKDFIDN